jgi:HAD superfamily phosphoserine phosphatase-like hydrolase
VLENSFSFFDFDNTLYKGISSYLILDFSEYLVGQGVILESAMLLFHGFFADYEAGRINRKIFGEQVVKAYYQNLTGAKENELSAQARTYWETLPQEAWFPYTQAILTLAQSFTTTIMISGSPVEIIKHIPIASKFDKIFASKGSIQAGVYTGKVEIEMATSESKAQLMDDLRNDLKFDPNTSFAFGDSESDFPMLRAVNPMNAYLLGEDGNLKGEVLKNHWNSFAHDNKVLKHVEARMNSCNSQANAKSDK